MEAIEKKIHHYLWDLLVYWTLRDSVSSHPLSLLAAVQIIYTKKENSEAVALKSIYTELMSSYISSFYHFLVSHCQTERDDP